MQTTNFEKELLKTMGVKGLINQAYSNTLLYAIRKIKTHFGVDMKFCDPGQVAAVIQWIEKYDNNFKSHIANPYLLNNKLSKQGPIIDRSFMIKLDKATWAFISGRYQNSKDSSSMNTIYMYIFGKMTFKYFKNLTKYIENNTSTTRMKFSITSPKSSAGRDSYWSCTGSVLTPRPMETLFFDSGIKERIIAHLDNWLANEQIYLNRGLIYKTGILLYGTPGTGKSSLASAIANYLQCGLVTIDCTTFDSLNVAEVAESINADEDRYVILLDEIDSVFGSRENENDSAKTARITKLLSFLDSPNSPSNVVFVATTNYIDKLDKAALRKGRFDLMEELTDIHAKTAYEMCKGFNLNEEQTNRVIHSVTFPVNPSYLQSVILDEMVRR